MQAMETRVVLFLLLTLSFLPSNTYSMPTESNGFAVELIHRDSPRSPYYKAYATTSDRWTAAFQRSDARLNYLNYVTRANTSAAASPDALQVPVTPTFGEYLMKISIGTPPVPMHLIIDTGSGLNWIQCIPCTECFTQRPPIFDPAKSYTFRNLSCGDKSCSVVDYKECRAGGQCGYFLKYVDQSYTRGDIVTDVLTLPSAEGEPDFAIPGMVFGCGRSNHGFDHDANSSGVAGFHMGRISFASQVGHFSGFKFSYCFVPANDLESGSQMRFGDWAVLSGNSTPIVEGAGNYYYVDLFDLSVGPNRLGIPPGIFRLKFDGTGGFLVDSGTTLTFLAKAGYDMLVSKLKEVVKFRVTKGLRPWQLCFAATSKDITQENFPTITFHFAGLDVPITPLSSFKEFTRSSRKKVCLMMKDSINSRSILGNLAQQNLNVGYDLETKKIFMAPFECATF